MCRGGERNYEVNMALRQNSQKLMLRFLQVPLKPLLRPPCVEEVVICVKHQRECGEVRPSQVPQEPRGGPLPRGHLVQHPPWNTVHPETALLQKRQLGPTAPPLQARGSLRLQPPTRGREHPCTSSPRGLSSQPVSERGAAGQWHRQSPQ